jgi:hypothetical protein
MSRGSQALYQDLTEGKIASARDDIRTVTPTTMKFVRRVRRTFGDDLEMVDQNANQRNPWDRPCSPEENSIPVSTAKQLYFSIGRALAEWSSIENELCSLFVMLYSGKHGYPAYKMYGSFPSTASRLNALKVTAEAFYAEKPEHAAYARALFGLTEKFLGRRNDIAHGLVVRVREHKAALMEPHFNQKHADQRSRKAVYEYEAHHVLGCAKQFVYLRQELTEGSLILFLSRLRKGRTFVGTPLSKYLEPEKSRLISKRMRVGSKIRAK